MRSLTLVAAFMAVICNLPATAQSIKKKIHVTVKEASTGKTIEGAVVTYKGLLGKSITATTDAAGQAIIEVTLLSRSATGTLIVSDGQTFSSYNDSKTTITLLDTQDYYEVTVSLMSDYKNIAVTVTDKSGPVANAKVILRGVRDPRDEVEYTNPAGLARMQALLIDNSKTVPVIVEKEGYFPYEGNITLTRKVQVYSVNVSLEKDPKTKILRVSVIGDDDNLPLPDASVTADAGVLTDFYRGSTDPAGVAELAIKTSGDYKITIQHRNYFPYEQTIKVIRHDDAEIPPLSVRLKRSKPKETDKVDLIVTVLGQKGGQSGPLPGAKVTVEHLSQEVGPDGKAVFEKVFSIGNSVKITASARNYATVELTTTLDNTERYTMSTQLQRELTLQYKAQDVKFLVKVLDETTDRPVVDAAVMLKAGSGKVIGFGKYPNPQGEVEYMLDAAEIANTTLKVSAVAPYYQERTSDVPISMVTSSDFGMYTLFLKKKEGVKEPGEKKFGPYTVVPGSWLPTGLFLKKGQYFRVEASGIIQYKDPPNTQNTPDGGGYWGWWQLKGKIGEQIMPLGSKGGGVAGADGLIELGAPATYRMGHAEEKALEGHYTVYVFSKHAVENKSPLVNPAAKDKLAKHVEFLERLKSFNKAAFEQRTVDEIIGEIKFIISEYQLQKIKGFDFTECSNHIRKVLSLVLYTNTVPSKEDMDMYHQCIESLDSSIKDQANRM
ncbi:MAG TPA: carboxypeptidase-like regulatory domain-containing protein [Chitinophagaceae bacterium]|nr:carboxypeptidase-like regulatory domain-containing protein [Chitinophagaceae bacterium]